MNQTIKDFIQTHEAEMIEMRRYLHQHPELSNEEYETTKFFASKLDELGVPYRTLEPTGVVAEIKGDHPGKTVLLRGDMDALPVNELNDHLDYKSQNEGKMHACGHDSHVSMLFLALRALNENKDLIHGTVRFIFQPAEEIGMGAKQAVEQGVLEGVDNAFGMHIWTPDPTGKVSVEAGPCFAAADRFEVKFTGFGGHAAQPHMTKDALVMGAQFAANVQSVISRRIDPLKSGVLTIGTFESGDRWNIIANDATLTGTVRTFDNDTRDIIEAGVKSYAQAVADAWGGQVEVTYDRLLDFVDNEDQSSALAQKVVLESFGEDHLIHNPPTMGGEDFGIFSQLVPGAFATVGCRNAEKETDYPHHHARFNVDEDALKVGAELYAQYALAYLNQDQF
ncbi:peptidase M20 [Aerococcus urinaehominis]|uniref:Peptidase M20 n=1 Tax=Aerococcus urinaehominis TaxID=128944 RepID=A0A0X8FKV3_9LACT|nr:amidohydrolase [Aerococcus urinaehominis]AMB99087.1 peptidase M20 [Aerococcus urinaehominis]SDM03201.1 amidohydrolase [Aerococcus urinaehominis]